MSDDNNIPPLPANPSLGDHARVFMDTAFQAAITALQAGVSPSNVIGSIEFIKADLMNIIQQENQKAQMAAAREKMQGGGGSKIILPPSSN